MEDLVRRVAVIATPAGNTAAVAAKAATATIPIVSGVSNDPVKLETTAVRVVCFVKPVRHLLPAAFEALLCPRNDSWRGKEK